MSADTLARPPLPLASADMWMTPNVNVILKYFFPDQFVKVMNVN